MKLYCTTYIDDALAHLGQRNVCWHGTQAEQRKHAKQLKTDGMRNIEPQEVTVPTGKAGLLEFLNEKGVRP